MLATQVTITNTFTVLRLYQHAGANNKQIYIIGNVRSSPEMDRRFIITL